MGYVFLILGWALFGIAVWTLVKPEDPNESGR